MPATWDVQVTVTDLEDRRVHVTATRTDDVSGDTWGWGFNSQIPAGATATQAANKIVTDVWAEWQAELTRQGQVAAFLSDIETQAESGLDAQESA